MTRKGSYRVEEIYQDSFWRIRTPEGKWLHHAGGILPNSFTDKGAAERICQDLNRQRESNARSIEFRVTHIEGCEYIVFRGEGGEYLTHKGNCTNRVHFAGVEAR